MPHQNVDAGEATAQNAATDKQMPNDQAHDRGTDQDAAVDPEPRSYAAPELRDSTLAPPAAGEIADYMDEGDALDGEAMQQGSTNRNEPKETDQAFERGSKTLQGDQSERISGSAN
jgi:hypothetical protein